MPRVATLGISRLGERPSARLEQACDTLAEQMFLSCRLQKYWDGSPFRCYWYANSAAAYLRLCGFNALCLDAILCVDLLDGGGQNYVHIGAPENGEPGLHSIVIVSDKDRRPWLLETSLFQAHRDRFHPLPDMMLIEASKTADSPQFADFGYVLAACTK